MEDPKRALGIFADRTQEDSASVARLVHSSRAMTEPLPAEPLRELLPVRMGAQTRVLARFRERRRGWSKAWLLLPAAAAVSLAWWISQTPEIDELSAPPVVADGTQKVEPQPLTAPKRQELPKKPRPEVVADDRPLAPERVVPPAPIPEFEVDPNLSPEVLSPELQVPPQVAEKEEVPPELPRVPVVVPPSALSARLVAKEIRELQATEDVDLQYRGTGVLSGDAAAPRIAWDTGTLHVSVTPKKGIDLQVRTADAEVHVVGTAFEVARSPLGTHVHVDHGRVWVACVTGERSLLGANEETWCLPSEPSGLLARALTLREQGASAEEVLMALELAQKKVKAGSVLGTEIAFQRLMTFAKHKDPRLDAELAAFVASNPAQRMDDARRLQVRRLVEKGECSAAETLTKSIGQKDLRSAAETDVERCR